MKKKIGLVLNNPISYSEIFFLNEIKLWKQLGYKVVVFEGYHEKAKADYQTIKGLPPLNKTAKAFPYLISRLLKLLFWGLPATVRFYYLEKNSSSSFLSIVKKIYKVAHILPEKVDYLHFGFANIAVGKEFVAKAIISKMSVSLRGADVAIYPLKEAEIYDKVWKNADKIHSISNDLLEKALKLGLTKDKKYTIIYQTLDLSKTIFKKNYGDFNNPIKIVTVGRLHWKKGFEYGLQVIKALKDSETKITYTIIGAGDYEEAIRFTIHDLEIQDIVYLTQALPYEEVLKKMSESDLYLQTSIQEGFCNAVLEAQASGLLVISTDAEGINENIIDGETGWLVPKRDVKAIVSKIKEVIDLTLSKRKQIALNARARVENEFYFSRYKEEWNNFFS